MKKFKRNDVVTNAIPPKGRVKDNKLFKVVVSYSKPLSDKKLRVLVSEGGYYLEDELTLVYRKSNTEQQAE